MEHPPLVTIGMPVYNGWPYIQEALDSLLAQDYPRLEIIVSDDGSTDGTAEYCQKLSDGDPRVRFWRNGQNLGPGGNFTQLARWGRGEFFMWAAQDDLWNRSYVTALVTALQAKPHAALATPATSIHWLFEYSEIRYFPPAPGSSRLETLRTLFRDEAYAWLYGLYRREPLIACMEELNRSSMYGSDYLFLLSLAQQYPFVSAPSARLTKREFCVNSLAPRRRHEYFAFWWRLWRHATRVALQGPGSLSRRRQVLALVWWWIAAKRVNPIVWDWLRGPTVMKRVDWLRAWWRGESLPPRPNFFGRTPKRPRPAPVVPRQADCA